jgi:hypothetical protein
VPGRQTRTEIVKTEYLYRVALLVSNGGYLSMVLVPWFMVLGAWWRIVTPARIF